MAEFLDWTGKRQMARAVGEELARTYGARPCYTPQEVQACASRLGYPHDWQSAAVELYSYARGRRGSALSRLFDQDFLS